MTVDLKPEQEQVIELALRSGAYHTPAEVLDRALKILREELETENWIVDQREAIAAHIETGFEQASRGDLVDGDAAIEMLRRRRAERPVSQG